MGLQAKILYFTKSTNSLVYICEVSISFFITNACWVVFPILHYKSEQQ